MKKKKKRKPRFHGLAKVHEKRELGYEKMAMIGTKFFLRQENGNMSRLDRGEK